MTYRPQFADIDVWGLTHIGKVRKTNQDHFMHASLTRGVTVERTSLEEGLDESVRLERLASLSVVADGVGSSPGGEQAARAAVQALVREVSKSFHDAQYEEATDPEVFSRLLQDAALACHESLVKRAEQELDRGRFATAVTLFLGLWPHAYLLQVGDTRCYVYQDGELVQITRDQTVAQHLVEQGSLSQTKAQSSRWANVLSSAIGGQEAAPVVTRIVRDWGAVILLCSDGLTKHVPDSRIKERIETMTSSRQLCEALQQDALDDGGTDNIAIVVGRTLRPAGE
jgi:serine/threonine protein phosphatase PrpC